MRFDHCKSLYFSGAVFILLLIGGFLLSRQKLLWNDELFTQQTAIDGSSYADIVLLKIPDGNKNPLYYIIQKSVCDLFSFHLPRAYSKVSTQTHDDASQIIMRLTSNMYMSLAAALIFYFFVRFYSLNAGLFALSVTMATPMVWEYWVEARPYSLWFLLTSVQLLLFCTFFIAPKIKSARWMLLTHVLLALTTPTCVFQIAIVTLILWLKKKIRIQQLIFMGLLPAGIAIFYYLVHTPSTIRTYMFGTNFFDVTMPEHLFVYVIYALIAWVGPEKYKKISWNVFFLPVFMLILASGFMVLFLDMFNNESNQGFFSRYLIYLTPSDILMFSLASIDLRRWSRQNPWVQMNVSIFLGGLVIMRGMLTYRDILAAATYLHAPG